MDDEIDRLKDEERDQMARDEWVWEEEETYDALIIDLKDEESEIILAEPVEEVRHEQVRDSDGRWGWGRLGILIAALVGFSVIADANVIGLIGRYWWLVFIVIAWRNHDWRFPSWPAFVLGFFMWGIMVGSLGIPALLAAGGMGLLAWLLSRRHPR